jgi:uncharacterized protein (TIGR02231 family)
MKNHLILMIIFSVLSFGLKAQETEIIIDARIKNITVYLNGAEFKCENSVFLKKGLNKIIINDLSPQLQSKSLQVAFDKDIEILSVNDKTNFLNVEKLEPNIRIVKDSIRYFESRIAQLGNEIDAFLAEKNILRKNEYIGSDQNGVSIDELKKATNYYREKTLSISNAITKLEVKKTRLNNKLNLSNKQLSELNYKNNPERKQAIIYLNSDVQQTRFVKLRYLASHAGWSPTYDLKAVDITKPIKLKYKAVIYNNTNINWNNVPLVLSTADPSLGATKPKLTTWNLNYRSNYNEGYLDKSGIGEYKKKAQNEGVAFQKVEVSELSTEFKIKKSYIIKSDSKPHIVDIIEYELEAKYEYIAIPKIDKDAFLLAKVSGWEKLDLISGNANVYFGGTYIGESYINTRLIEETLDLSLGRDKQVIVTRGKIEDISKKKFIAANTTDRYLYEIIVKNNKSKAITIDIQDQVPISQESDIKVNVIDISGAKLDDTNGKIDWIATLKPGESKKYLLSFSVKYPKSKKVKTRRNRTLKSARFF